MDLGISPSGRTYAKCPCGTQMTEYTAESNHKIYVCKCGNHIIPFLGEILTEQTTEESDNITDLLEPDELLDVMGLPSSGRVSDLFSDYDAEDGNVPVYHVQIYILHAVVPYQLKYYRGKIQYNDEYLVCALNSGDITEYFNGDWDIAHKYLNDSIYSRWEYPHKLWISYEYLTANCLMPSIDIIAYYHIISPFSDNGYVIKTASKYDSPL